MAVALLFSTAVAYGATKVEYNYTLETGAGAYTNLVAKTTTTGYSKVEQTSLDCVIEYKVVDALHLTKSELVHISGASTVNIDYHDEVVKGGSLKLKVYNDPADNQGSRRTVSGRWTP